MIMIVSRVDTPQQEADYDYRSTATVAVARRVGRLTALSPTISSHDSL